MHPLETVAVTLVDNFPNLEYHKEYFQYILFLEMDSYPGNLYLNFRLNHIPRRNLTSNKGVDQLLLKIQITLESYLIRIVLILGLHSSISITYQSSGPTAA